MLALIAAVLLAPAPVLGGAILSLPQQTDSIQQYLGHPVDAPVPTPATTQAASLEKRQVGRSTCGYLNALSQLSFVCNPGYTCAVATGAYLHGCCASGQQCYLATSCIDYNYLSYAPSAALYNTQVVKCTDYSMPMCIMVRFAISGYYYNELNCGPARTTITAYTTYTDGYYSSDPPSLPSTTPRPSVRPSPAPSPPDEDDTNHRPSSSTTTEHPVRINGKAVGGAVVGGLAALAAIIGGIFWCFKKRGKGTDNNNTTTGAAPEISTTGGGNGPAPYAPGGAAAVAGTGQTAEVQPISAYAATASAAPEKQDYYTSVQPVASPITPMSPAPPYQPATSPPPQLSLYPQPTTSPLQQQPYQPPISPPPPSLFGQQQQQQPYQPTVSPSPPGAYSQPVPVQAVPDQPPPQQYFQYEQQQQQQQQPQQQYSQPQQQYTQPQELSGFPSPPTSSYGVGGGAAPEQQQQYYPQQHQQRPGGSNPAELQ